MIHHGDCVEVMAGMEPESVDAIVTDPPYGLGFMGKAWDDAGRLASVPPSAVRLAESGRDPYPRTGKGPAAVAFDGHAYQRWCEAWAREALRVAKPGAYLLAFGGTRTVHRLACAIEDAGWIIRDTLVWAYAQGFPKSKASLKPSWEPIVWARKPFSVAVESVSEIHHALAALIWLTERAPDGHGCASERVARLFAESDPTATSRSRAVASTSSSIASSWASILVDASGDTSRFTTSTGSRLTTALRTLSSCLSPVTSGITMPLCECLHDGSSSPANGAASGSSGEHTSTLDTLKRSVPESAIGPIAQSVASVCAAIAADLSADRAVEPTAPDPATTRLGADSRPIVMARKPGPLRELAINACRIPAEPYSYPNGPRGGVDPTSYAYPRIETPVESHPLGRWPANVILTDPVFDGGIEGVVGGGESVGVGGFPAVDNQQRQTYGGFTGEREAGPARTDGGTYSRFFLIPKADRADREPVLGGRPVREQPSTWGDIGPVDGNPRKPATGHISRRSNTHPTVKPTELMRHLVRLVTPSGGTVLDPFAGSGSTLIAAEQEGFQWIGIEKEAEYIAIAEARLNGTQRGLGLDVPAPTEKRGKMPPHVGSGTTWWDSVKQYADEPSGEDAA